jgi:hypothetical protein
MRSVLTYCAVAGALVTPGLNAQGTGENARKMELRLDPAVAAEVMHITDSARLAGLPSEPLLDKALEGVSKHADDRRIVQAVRGLAQRLGAARAALGPAASESDLVAAAGALYQGVPPTDLTRLRAVRNGQPIALPLVVLTDLIERGVPKATATSVVMDVARTGAGDAAFVALRQEVEQDITAGAPPAIAAATRARGTISGIPVRTPIPASTAGAGAPTAASKPTIVKP